MENILQQAVTIISLLGGAYAVFLNYKSQKKSERDDLRADYERVKKERDEALAKVKELEHEKEGRVQELEQEKERLEIALGEITKRIVKTQ